MGIYFVIGAMLSSFLLIQINFAIILAILILANVFPAFSSIIHVIGIIVGFVLVAGHIRATTAIMPEVFQKSDETAAKAEENEQKIYKVDKEQETLWDIFYSTLFSNIYIIAHGVAWRFKKEGQYIKRVAGFNFKSAEENSSPV